MSANILSVSQVMSPAVDAITECPVRKLRGEVSYTLLVDKYHSWDEKPKKVRKMMFDD